MKKLLLLLVFVGFLFSNAIITPIELEATYNKEKALLGKKLFFETKLSSTNNISCFSCHNLYEGGDDNRELALGVNGKIGKVNSPTLLNVKYNVYLSVDGRTKDLKKQILDPIHNKVEMASDFKTIIKKLKKDIYYKKTFLKVYDEEINENNIIDALVEFEKALITPNSSFDKYLRGDKTALNNDEKEGYALFKSYGCISCHNGVNLGANLFHKIGIIKEFDMEEDESLGRYNVTKNIEDKYFYKVPILRNISLTAPYFHNGKVKTLLEAINIMIEYQVGMSASIDEVKKIESFLKTLNGDVPSILDKI